MLEGIIKTAFSKIFFSAIGKIYRSPWVNEFFNSFYVALEVLKIPYENKDTVRKFRQKLVRLILADQFMEGIHKGQFGKSTSHSESKKWQVPGSNENLDIKPKMYLTYWSVLVLEKRKLASHAIMLARFNMKNLFLKNNNKIPVHRSATPNMSPLESIHPVFSYRHTMAGALILSIFEEWNEVTRSTLDEMIDRRNNWQGANGDWKQVSDDCNSIDIWTSAYAAKLLANCLSSESHFSEDEKTKAKEIFDKTILFLEAEWRDNRWAFAKLDPEEAAVLLYIELFEVLKTSKSSLIDDCITEFTTWLSPRGNLSDSYKTKLSHLSEAQLYARMSYAFYLNDNVSNKWRILFENLPRCDLKKMYVSDLAYALDMSFDYSTDDNLVIEPTFLVETA
jgi:hypothetical protein